MTVFIAYCIHPSPLGDLLLVSNGAALTDLHVMRGKYVPTIEAGWQCVPDDPVLRLTASELDAYFSRRLTQFSVPLAPHGTPFQQAAWAALCAIPYGQTRSYGAQALAMGKPAAARAVGAANGRNPLGIIIPCHRVLGANGDLTGYAGGLDAKQFLLRLEGALPTQADPLSRQDDWLNPLA
jgi:methylated-DNA-[protein]-cysteine S-methyltransferase